jgi:hypothetical protein
MKFKVFWHPVARKILADLWLKSDPRVRKLLNQASDQIDRALSRDPLSEGESRSAGRRIAFAPPLGAARRHFSRRSNDEHCLRAADLVDPTSKAPMS